MGSDRDQRTAALTMRDDQNHPKATRFVERNPQARFVMTDLILVELVTLVRARVDAHTAVRVADSLLRSRRYEIVFLDADLMGGALKQMIRYSDKRLASFEAMVRLGIASAFCFDRHFRDCGFEMLP